MIFKICGVLSGTSKALGLCLVLGPALAQVPGEQEKLDRAIEAYRIAIELRTSNVEHYVNLGDALLRTGRLDEARVSYRQAIVLTPDSARAWLAFGKVLELTGESESARDAYRRAIELEPDSPEGNYYLGLRSYEAGELVRTVRAMGA